MALEETAPFVWGSGGARLTPEQIDAQRKVAQAMMERGMDYSPIRHWTQGGARVSQALLGALESRDADAAAKTNAVADREMIASLINGGGTPTTSPGGMPAVASPVSASPSAVQTVPADQFNSIDAMADLKPETQARMAAVQNAVSGIESGGRYGATGPMISSGPMAGQRAIGKYQVMEGNVAPWTKEVMGQPMTPQQFAANPDAQDAVFNGKFGGYMDKYGTAGATRAWHAGEGGMNNPLAQDQLGTKTSTYGQNVAAIVDGSALPPNAKPAGPAPAAPPVQAAGSLQGVNPALVQALASPYASDGVKKIAGLILQQQMGDKVTYQTLPDGTILALDPHGRQAPKPVYSAPVKPELKESGTDPITGAKSFQVFDPKTQTMRPVSGPGGAPAAPQSGFLAPGVAAIDHSLSGDDYLKQYGPEVQAAVKSYINGDVMPSGNPRMQSLANTAKTIAQKYGQDMGIPVSDATYSQRRTYRSQLGSNSPNSSGGQAKAFNQGIEHMGHLADTLEQLDNSNGLGIPFVASAINSGRQAISTDQSAVADKASSIGQTLAGEVGKLFSGSAGGGVHERELTRERFSTVKSKPQLAAALEGTLEMMRGGLTALEQRRDEVMGPNSGIRFVNPETEAKMAKIQETIDRLKKGTAPKPSAGGSDIDALLQKYGAK